MKITTIVGARPQFIKAASVSRAIQNLNQDGKGAQIVEVLVHTGQHYDHNMSQVFFDELGITKPDYDLEVGSASHGKMTGMMLERIELVLQDEKPDWVLVYGDTNSTLAGALAAAKLHIPVAHVEAGLRSFNRRMPEEINRVLTDHVSCLLFCPTDAAVVNLEKEGITKGVIKVGDVMFDSFLYHKDLAAKKSTILNKLDLNPECYCLATVHREENTNNRKNLAGIFEAFRQLAHSNCQFIVPLHPRTAKVLSDLGGHQPFGPHVRVLEPVSYLDMVALETHAKMIFTDSGGVQKEAYFAQVPCITLRDETEWVELVEHGFNMVAGTSCERICAAYEETADKSIEHNSELYGDGRAGERIVSRLRG